MDQAILTDLRERLASAQAKARRLRCEAFVRYSPSVAGVHLLPLTLDSYNLLVAWGNPFVCGGPIAFTDIFQFIWAHHPEFGQFASSARRRVLLAVTRAMQPRFPTLSSIARVLAPFPRLHWLARFIEPSSEDLLQAAIDECSRIVVEGIGEFPTDHRSCDSTGPASEPLPFGLQAQVLGLMCREFGLPFSATRSMPMKELGQHLREVTWVGSKGKALLLTPEEVRIWDEYHAVLEADARAAETSPSVP